MPEYVPAPQLPTGLAEETVRLASQRGQFNPGVAMANALSQVIQQYALGRGQYMQNMIPNASLMGMGILPPGASPIGRTPVKAAELGAQTRGQELAMKKALEVQGLKGEQEMLKTHTAATDELLNQHPKLKAIFQTGELVPNRMIEQELKPPPASGQLTEKVLQDEWVKLDRLANPTVAMRGSPLGTAGLLNMRADRALQILTSPDITPQRKAMVLTDIAGIMHGGSPDEVELKAQMYGTLYDRVALLAQQVMNKPETVNQPEIQKELQKIVRDLKAVDTRIITKNLDAQEIAFAPVIEKTKDRWKKYKEVVLSGTADIGSLPEIYQNPTGEGQKGDDLDALIEKHLKKP